MKKKPIIFILFSIWLIYVLLELFNPEAVSITAWFYAMRAMALYGWLIALFGMNAEFRKVDLVRFFRIWLFIALIGGLYGIRMQLFGPLPFERKWLAEGAYRTHVLWGKLRVFSFYTDANTYGNSMGLAFVASSILFLGPFSRKTKFKLILCALLTLLGMTFSGTRGAYGIPGAGFLTYVLVARNQFLRTALFSAMIIVFILLKFTYLGQSIIPIQRMRSALDVNDPSLQLRVTNRKMLSKYLSDKPFGGGIGSSGYWGQRFSPNTWLANFEPDGVYTQLRAECGPIGKNIFLLIYIFLLLRGIRFLINTKNEEIFTFSAAIVCMLSGLLLASYSGSAIQQIPNSIVMLLGLVFLEKMQQGLITGKEPTKLVEADSSLEIER